MEQELKAKVVEIILDKYILKLENGKYVEAILKGNVKKKNSILVGDFVKASFMYDTYVITDVLERMNMLIRPPVANIDQLVIVLAITNPEFDYMLLDKELVLCKSKNIEPILCINKVDLAKSDDIIKEKLDNIISTYKKIGLNIIKTSALSSIGISKLKEILLNKTSSFSGNSGVGKSSITNLILKENTDYDKLKKIEIGNISKKSKKGRHTTKCVKLYSIDNNSYLLDTPGFSSFEINDIYYKDLKKYYEEFSNYSCEFEDCNHINEDVKYCGVKKAVSDNEIDKGRYDRYVYLFNKLKEIDDKKYK